MCLLIMLYTGRKPTKRTFEMVCFIQARSGSQGLPTALHCKGTR